MNPAAGPLPPVTDEQRQLAWRAMRRPAGWPATLAEALEDRCRRIAIDGYARTMGRPAFRQPDAPPAHRLPSAPVPPTPAAPPKAPAKQRSHLQRPLPAFGAYGAFDARRAAANDFDDK